MYLVKYYLKIGNFRAVENMNMCISKIGKINHRVTYKKYRPINLKFYWNLES